MRLIKGGSMSTLSNLNGKVDKNKWTKWTLSYKYLRGYLENGDQIV